MLFHFYIGMRGEDEMSPDPVPLSPDESDPLPPVEKSTGVADIREEISVGPDSVSQGTSITDSVFL